jgi:hypothetical protein
MSGLMIISSQRLILASGPFHHIIPYTEILSIEDDHTFPLPEGGKVKVMPIIHSSGIDAYLTIVGVTPSIMRTLTRDIYAQICNFYRGFYILEGSKEIPVSIKNIDNGMELLLQDGRSFLMHPEPNLRRSVMKSHDLWRFELGGREKITLHSHPLAGRWLDLFINHFFHERKERVEERYLQVLRYLASTPSTTGGISSKLGMVALEASTILNEMVFLGWVSLDHFTKLYQINPIGLETISSNDQGPDGRI